MQVKKHSAVAAASAAANLRRLKTTLGKLPKAFSLTGQTSSIVDVTWTETPGSQMEYGQVSFDWSRHWLLASHNAGKCMVLLLLLHAVRILPSTSVVYNKAAVSF